MALERNEDDIVVNRVVPREEQSFLNRQSHIWSLRFRLWRSRLWTEYDVAAKLKDLLALAFNVTITGLAIWYCLTFRNFISYGITAALATYYVGWVIDKVKEKPLKQ